MDGVGPVNRGLLFGGAERHALLPATPLACLELLTEVPVQPAGKRAVVVGRGDTVGRPLAALLISRHATVTVCHTRTNDLAAVVREADLVFAAAGRPGVITGDMVRPGATVIDAGITEVDGALTGDVDWDTVAAVAGAVTPVPGGVGSVTTSIIMNNVLRARSAAAGEWRPLMNDAPHAERLLQLPVTAFLDRTASASATPGGGSVAAVTGALASALVAMVARLTDHKKGYEQAWELGRRGGPARGPAHHRTAGRCAGRRTQLRGIHGRVALAEAFAGGAAGAQRRPGGGHPPRHRRAAGHRRRVCRGTHRCRRVGASSQPPRGVGHRRRGAPGRGRGGRCAADGRDQPRLGPDGHVF